MAVSLVLQGQSAAARVTMTDAVGQIVICTGTGPMAVYVDADGQPVDAPETCPDCLILSIVALLVAPIDLPRRCRSDQPAVIKATYFRPDWLTWPACARAPPSFVSTI